MKICKIKGCEEKHEAKGYCHTHYERIRRNGTLELQNKTHGMTGTPIYWRWMDMKKRCSYKKHKSYHTYGGLGIKVCERWMDFRNFIFDMGYPQEGMQIDRIDNSGDYEPGNCRWTTPSENSRNRSATKLNTEAVKVIKYAIKHMGRTKGEVAKLYGISQQTIYNIMAGRVWADVDIDKA